MTPCWEIPNATAEAVLPLFSMVQGWWTPALWNTQSMSLLLVVGGGMGEGGMICCHDVSLEVQAQEEGLECATNLWQGHSPLPAPDGVVQELQGLVGAEMLHSPRRCSHPDRCCRKLG